MTNKDNASKAREIANEFANESVRPAIRIAAEEMAEWKDQQFKEYLEKKAIEAGKKRDADLSLGSDWDEWNDRYWAYMSVIDELFGETEQDNSERED